MRSSHFFLSSFIVLVFTSVQAQELSPAESLLEKDMLNSKGGINSFNKNIRLYHYLDTAMKGNQLWPTYQTPQDRAGQTLFDLSHIAGAFWDQNYHDTKLVNAAPGMYLAIEPLVSQSFGHSTYILNFESGTKYIDVTDPTWKNVSKIKLAPQTIPALIEEGILSRASVSKLGMSGGYFTRITMQYLAATENSRLRETVSKIFERNNIVLVAFSWEPTKIKLICRNSSDTAFNYIGSKPSGPLTGTVTATISPDVVANAVFMSTYSVAQYTPQETSILQLTQQFKSALAAGQSSQLGAESLTELKQVTYSCQ